MTTDLNAIVSHINGRKGVHYRPHRTDPANFVVIKIYRRWDEELSEEQAREVLVAYLAGIGVTPEDEDPSNVLLAVETQLNWLREIGFEDVDCYWKWLELSLFGGSRRKL